MWVRSDTCDIVNLMDLVNQLKLKKASKTSEPGRACKTGEATNELVNHACDDQELPSELQMPHALNVAQL